MGTKNERNTSGVYRAEALRLIQSRRIWILCGILWLYLMIQGTEIYREVGADREIIRGFWQQTVIQILRKKETVVLVASVSGIAHAASCMEDFQSRFYKFYLARMDVGAYIRGKIFGNFIGVTGMILAAGMLGILGIYLLYSPAETGTIEWKKELENIARIYSVEEGKTITFLDLMRRGIQEKYQLGEQNDEQETLS